MNDCLHYENFETSDILFHIIEITPPFNLASFNKKIKVFVKTKSGIYKGYSFDVYINSINTLKVQEELECKLKSLIYDKMVKELVPLSLSKDTTTLEGINLSDRSLWDISEVMFEVYRDLTDSNNNIKYRVV